MSNQAHTGYTTKLAGGQKVAYQANFQPGVIPARGLVGIAVGIQRFVALVLIVVSTWGNFVQFNGGWERWLAFDERGTQALIGAAVWQVFFFAWQFSMLRVGAKTWYIFALLASCVPSFLSYYDLTFEPLLAIISLRTSAELARVVAFIVVLVGVVGTDMVPERVLVKG